MAAQYLSDAATQQSVMNSLFTVFAGFTAFGAAIVAVLAGGGAVQKVADYWGRREERRHPRLRCCRLLEPVMIGSVTALICLVVLGSGTGLMLSFLWLHAAGSGSWSWAYGVSVDLFESEVAALTVVTFVAVVAASASATTAKAAGNRRPAANTAARQLTPTSELAYRAAGTGQRRSRPAPAAPTPDRPRRTAGPGAGHPAKGSRPRQRENRQMASTASSQLPPDRRRRKHGTRPLKIFMPNGPRCQPPARTRRVPCATPAVR